MYCSTRHWHHSNHAWPAGAASLSGLMPSLCYGPNLADFRKNICFLENFRENICILENFCKRFPCQIGANSRYEIFSRKCECFDDVCENVNFRVNPRPNAFVNRRPSLPLGAAHDTEPVYFMTVTSPRIYSWKLNLIEYIHHFFTCHKISLGVYMK